MRRRRWLGCTLKTTLGHQNPAKLGYRFSHASIIPPKIRLVRALRARYAHAPRTLRARYFRYLQLILNSLVTR